ncbi:protein SUPPRESSOR OF QUENCHING 1, chloroplastic-like isoform X3 [Vigna angularis]|uniref:protein SUPPRESSOR OF QUENCHING 1, chloroplastic-like isoform X3 n=1 Tax=Phaseolus angularis TaxID=3914 RepID=UPI0022B2F9B8|nr:protein SUPPRESSOR OF QUENCHING 1, chloroplastic-like isoform X3 [Vigna angularis]
MDGMLCNNEEPSRKSDVDLFAEMGVEVTVDDFVAFTGTASTSEHGACGAVEHGACTTTLGKKCSKETEYHQPCLVGGESRGVLIESWDCSQGV